MSVAKQTKQEEDSSARIKILLRKIARSNDEMIEDGAEIGFNLLRIKKSKIYKGRFNPSVEIKFGIGKTQQALYMKLSLLLADLPEARNWGRQKGLASDTLTDVVRLLSRFQKRHQAFKPRKNSSSIGADEARRTKGVFNLWVHPNTMRGEADCAELKLFRFAERRSLSLKSYLLKLKLEIPEHRRPEPLAV